MIDRINPRRYDFREELAQVRAQARPDVLLYEQPQLRFVLDRYAPEPLVTTASSHGSRGGQVGRDGATVRSMRVEILYFDGCPNHEALLPHLRELLSSAGASTDIELVRVQDADGAERERFLGSPTLRIDGEDVEPGAEQRSDFGLKCRLFATPGGLRGMPPDEWVLTALERAHTPSS